MQSQGFQASLVNTGAEFVDSYSKMTLDYNFNQEQKRHYLHTLLRKDAARFYSIAVGPYAATFKIAADMTSAQYSSAVRQTQILDYLDGLSHDTFTSTGLSESAALAKVFAEIVCMSSQLPSSHGGDAHRIRFMRHSVSNRAWSHPALQRVASSGLSFQKLCGELESALQLQKKGTSTKNHQNIMEKRAMESSFHYIGQGRFKRGRSNLAPRTQGSSPSPLDVDGCFECDDRGHMARDYPKPLNLPRAAQRKLEYMRKKKAQNPTQQLPFDIFLQTTEIVDDLEENFTADDNSPESFGQLLASCLGSGDDKGNKQDASLADMVYLDTCDDSTIHLHSVDKLGGACGDSGAQTNTVYKFGEKRHTGLGTITIDMPVSDPYYIEVSAEITDVEVPFLLGLYMLTDLRTVLDFETDRPSGRVDGWSVPLIRKMGHLYAEWPVRVLFSSSQLRRLHRNFKHSSPERPYAFMKRAESHGKHLKLLKERELIRRSCDVCQREADAPWQFRVSLSNEDDAFNANVCLDIMKLSSRSVLHAVNNSTRYGTARCLPSESTSDVRSTFDLMWTQAYFGLPDTVGCDQGSVFTSAEW